MYGFLWWAFQQVFPDKAESEFLSDWAAVWGVVRKPASPAIGQVQVKGTPNTGLIEDSLAKSQTGVTYKLAGVILPSGTGDVVANCQAEALEAGIVGNLAAGQKLTLINPVAGLSSELIVQAGGLAGGVDLESDEALRARLIKTIQEPPHGGNKADYEVWALEVQGVEKALCFPTYSGLGTVAVAVWGLPENPILSNVTVAAAYEHLLENCPVTAGPGLYVFTPESMSVNFTIRLVPDTQVVRDNVRRELWDLFDRSAAPGKTIPLSHLQEAISLAAGEYDHELISPTASITPEQRQLPILGQLEFIA
jgi:uncharacterized phage protein gp47/JayE